MSVFGNDTRDRRRSYEEGVERQTDNVDSKGKHHDIDLAILEGHHQSSNSSLTLSILISLTNILDHSKLSYCKLLLRDTTGVARKIGKDEDGQDGDEHGNGSLNYVIVSHVLCYD